jgi:pimeloyl-ACP methyl ester carboxylesterase
MQFFSKIIHFIYHHKKKWIAFFLFLIFGYFMSGCMQFRMSDEQIRKHFKGKELQPKILNYTILDRNIRYAEVGNDTLPLVIFVHGAPGGLDAFIDFLSDNQLNKIAKLISVDRPGYGYSGFGESETSIQRQSLMLEPLLELNRSSQKIILVGHSYGGAIVAKMAIQHPDKVRAILLAAPALDPDNEKIFWVNKPANWWGVKWMIPTALRVSNDEKLAHIEELKLLLPHWKNLNTHVSLLHGESDGIVPFENVAFLKKMLKEKQLHIITEKKLGHLIPFERPELIKNEIIRILNNEK